MCVLKVSRFFSKFNNEPKRTISIKKKHELKFYFSPQIEAREYFRLELVLEEKEN
jgi:hypothetical protein